MYGKEFTIIVPTYRRSHFLGRMIGALNELGFAGQLFLSDSSARDEFTLVDQLIRDIAPSYHVEHISAPKAPRMPLALSLNHAVAVAASMVETKYLTLTCDDDIPVPATLEKASVIMDNKEDIRGVLGDHVFLYLNDKLNKKDYTDSEFPQVGELHPTVSNMKATAEERLMHFTQYYCNTMFLMTRTEHYLDAIPPESYQINFPHFSAEYMWMFTPVLQGKIQKIDALQVVRQKHGSNISNTAKADPNRSITEAILKPHWHHDANLFVNHLARHLSDVDGMADQDALAVAKEAFGEIIAQRLQKTVMGRARFTLPEVRELTRLYRTVGSNEQIFFSECANKILNYDITEPIKY